MKHMIFICSHNSKEYTQYVYDALKAQTPNVKVLENSDIPERKFLNNDTIDLGDENIEIGGYFDYIIENYSDLEDTFVGIFNNDLLNIPDDYMENLIPYFRQDVGVVSSSLDDPGCPYRSNIHVNNSEFREVDVIEGVCPFYNTKVLRIFKKYVPINKCGYIDYYASKKADQMGLKNIIVDKTILKHIRSGVRVQMESIKGSLKSHNDSLQAEYHDWLNLHQDLKNLH